MVAKSDIAERFWSKVDKRGPVPAHRPWLGRCWIWTAGKFPDGCGAIKFNGRQRRAPVIAYILTTGHEPPSDKPIITHRCDGGKIACVRPYHLRPGTFASNAAERDKRGRQAKGAQIGQGKLSPALVAEIRDRYGSGHVYQYQLAAEYGVSQAWISKIVRGEWWRHVA